LHEKKSYFQIITFRKQKKSHRNETKCILKLKVDTYHNINEIQKKDLLPIIQYYESQIWTMDL